ncbi:YlbF family regulator, partial [Listeria monocytogenes]
MLATMENMALLDLSDELASMILDSEEAQNYKHTRQVLLDDANSQKNIRQFIRIKDQYEEVQRFGRYHPDYKEVTRKTRAYKREVDMDQNVAAFRRAEMDLQSLLDEISLLLASAVSENIKVPT